MLNLTVEDLLLLLEKSGQPYQTISEEGLGLGSYRGDYHQLAVGEPGDIHTVGDLVRALRRVVEDRPTFEGYKGGEFQMDRHVLVFLADYGDSSPPEWCGPLLEAMAEGFRRSRSSG